MSCNCQSREALPLQDYIDKFYHGNQSAFGRSFNPKCSRQRVNDWIKNGWIVVGQQLYSPAKTNKLIKCPVCA